RPPPARCSTEYPWAPRPAVAWLRIKPAANNESELPRASTTRSSRRKAILSSSCLDCKLVVAKPDAVRKTQIHKDNPQQGKLERFLCASVPLCLCVSVFFPHQQFTPSKRVRAPARSGAGPYL